MRVISFSFVVSFIKPLLVMVGFQIVFLKQPDFGAAMSLAFLTFALLQRIDPSLNNLNDYLNIFYNSPDFLEEFKLSVCQREEPNEVF